MILIGADTHMRTHTVAAVREGTGRQLASRTVATGAKSFATLLQWARRLDDQERVWAIENCHHVSGALERFLLAHAERAVRVPPNLSARTRRQTGAAGESDEIDALAIARAAIAEGLDNLPVAQLAGPELDVRLACRSPRTPHRPAHRADQRAARWHLHDLRPELAIPSRVLTGPR